MDNSFSKLVEYFRLIDEFNLKGQGVIEYDQQSLSEVNIPDLKEIITVSYTHLTLPTKA